MITSQRASLPTIISRCQGWSFSPPSSSSEISNYLVEKKGWKEEEAREIFLSQVAGKAEEIKEGRSVWRINFGNCGQTEKREGFSLSLGSGSMIIRNSCLLIMIFLEQYLRDLWVEGNGGSML